MGVRTNAYTVQPGGARHRNLPKPDPGHRAAVQPPTRNTVPSSQATGDKSPKVTRPRKG